MTSSGCIPQIVFSISLVVSISVFRYGVGLIAHVCIPRWPAFQLWPYVISLVYTQHCSDRVHMVQPCIP